MNLQNLTIRQMVRMPNGLDETGVRDVILEEVRKKRLASGDVGAMLERAADLAERAAALAEEARRLAEEAREILARQQTEAK